MKLNSIEDIAKLTRKDVKYLSNSDFEKEINTLVNICKNLHIEPSEKNLKGESIETIESLKNDYFKEETKQEEKHEERAEENEESLEIPF